MALTKKEQWAQNQIQNGDSYSVSGYLVGDIGLPSNPTKKMDDDYIEGYYHNPYHFRDREQNPAPLASPNMAGRDEVLQDDILGPFLQQIQNLPSQDFENPYIAANLKKDLTLKNVSADDKDHIVGAPEDVEDPTQETKPFDYVLGAYTQWQQGVDSLETGAYGMYASEIMDKAQTMPNNKNAQNVLHILQQSKFNDQGGVFNTSSLGGSSGLTGGYPTMENINANPVAKQIVNDYIQGVPVDKINPNSPLFQSVKKFSSLQPGESGLNHYIKDSISDVNNDGSPKTKIAKRIISKINNGESLSQIRQDVTPYYNQYLVDSASKLTKTASLSILKSDLGTSSANQNQLNNLHHPTQLDEFINKKNIQALEALDKPINNPTDSNIIQNDINQQKKTADIFTKNGGIYQTNVSNLNKWITDEQDLSNVSNFQNKYDTLLSTEENQLQQVDGKTFSSHAQAYNDAAHFFKNQDNNDIANELNNISKDMSVTQQDNATAGYQNYKNAFDDLKNDQSQLSNIVVKADNLSKLSLTDKLVRDDLQLDAINHPNNRNAIANFFEDNQHKDVDENVTQALEAGVNNGNMSFNQMDDMLAHNKTYSGPNDNANAFEQINKQQLIERDSQESLELAEKMDPDFKPQNTKQLENNLAQGDLSRAGLENEVHLQQAVGHALPLSKNHQYEDAPDAFNVSHTSKNDQNIMKSYEKYQEGQEVINRKHTGHLHSDSHNFDNQHDHSHSHMDI